MPFWFFNKRRQKKSLLHSNNLNSGQKIIVNGKTYVKVKLRFVDTLKFSTEKYIDGLETKIDFLENELKVVNELYSNNEIKIKQLQQLNVNLTNETRNSSHSSSRDSNSLLRIYGKVQKLEREINRKANELVMLKSHSEYLQKRNNRILKPEPIKPQPQITDSKNKIFELLKKFSLNKILAEKNLKSDIQKKEIKILKLESNIFGKEKEIIELKDVIAKKEKQISVKIADTEILKEEIKDSRLDKVIINKQENELERLKQSVIERDEQIKNLDNKIEKLQCLNRNLAENKVEVKKVIIEDASIHEIKKSGERLKAQYKKEIKKYKDTLKELKKHTNKLEAEASANADPWDRVTKIWAQSE